MNQKFGMMDVGNFTSKKELLTWIEEYLQLKVQKIEDLGQGSVFCQILDACFPGQVPLGRVNWKPVGEYQFILNFKILTNAMNKLKVIKIVDVPKLVKCRTQDNLELCQWLKRFFDLNKPDNYRDYDPVKRRNYQATPFDICDPKEKMFSEDFKAGSIKVISQTESKKNIQMVVEDKNTNVLFQEFRNVLQNNQGLSHQQQIHQLKNMLEIPISVPQSAQKPQRQVLQEIPAEQNQMENNQMQCEEDEQSHQQVQQDQQQVQQVQQVQQQEEQVQQLQQQSFLDQENVNTANFGQLVNQQSCQKEKVQDQQQQQNQSKQNSASKLFFFFSNSKKQQQQQQELQNNQ